MACHLYERMMLLCYNQYGALEARERPECVDATHYFDQCLTINNYFATIQKYMPETLASNPYSRYKPHFKELDI